MKLRLEKWFYFLCQSWCNRNLEGGDWTCQSIPVLCQKICPVSEKKSLTQSQTLFLNKGQQLEEPSAAEYLQQWWISPPDKFYIFALPAKGGSQVVICVTCVNKENIGQLADCDANSEHFKAIKTPRSTRSSLCKHPSKLRFHSQSSSGIKRAGRKSSITCLLSGTSKYIHSFAEWQFPTSG